MGYTIETSLPIPCSLRSANLTSHQFLVALGPHFSISTKLLTCGQCYRCCWHPMRFCPSPSQYNRENTWVFFTRTVSPYFVAPVVTCNSLPLLQSHLCMQWGSSSYITSLAASHADLILLASAWSLPCL